MKRFWSYFASGTAFAILAAVVLGYGGVIWYPLDLLAHFRLHLLLLIPAAVWIALLVQNWTAVLRLATAALFALAGLAPVWESVDLTAQGTPLTVMTANLNYLNEDIELARAALLKADADVLVTHETDKAVQAGITSLANHYRYRLALPTPRKRMRTVIWSKFPMRDGQLMLEDAVEPTGAMAVVELEEGREVVVMGLHLNHAGRRNQGIQVEAVARLLEGRPYPRVIMGDFNATPWSWAMIRVAQLSRTRLLPGYRVTWRGEYPSKLGMLPAVLGQPIDHILVSQGIGLERIETVVIPGSDHLAVKARLSLP